jgi:hypothetical protein
MFLVLWDKFAEFDHPSNTVKIGILDEFWGFLKTPEGFQKRTFSNSKMKKTNNSSRIYPTELAGSTENYKKILKHQIKQSKREFSQKNFVSYLISGKEPKICMLHGLHDGICRLDPKS